MMTTLLLAGLILSALQEEEKASELLEKARTRLQKADVISVQARMVSPGGEEEGLSRKMNVLVKRPDRARVVMTMGEEKVLLVADGKTLWTWFETEKMYSKVEQSEGMLGEILPAGIVTLLFLEEGLPEWTKEATEVKVSPGKLGEQDCQIISMKLPEMRVRIWLDSESRIRKSEDVFQMEDQTLTQTTIYEKENLTPAWKESDFSFTPPEGSKEMEMGRGPGGGDDLLAIGSQAPAFECTDLEGRSVKLSDLQGKVVLLNFWFYH